MPLTHYYGKVSMCNYRRVPMISMVYATCVLNGIYFKMFSFFLISYNIQ